MKSKTKTKPIYDKEITGAASTLTSAYNQAAPGIAQASETIGSLTPGLLEQYKQGDPTLDAARKYSTDVLSGRYLDEGNPYLSEMAGLAADRARNQTQAAMGTRGLTNGSDYAAMIARRVAEAELGMRYQDYDAERARMGQAASMAPGFIAADSARLDPIMQTTQAQLMPLQAASGYASGIGGLLGQYTKTTQKAPLFQTIMQGLSSAAKYAAGGA